MEFIKIEELDENFNPRPKDPFWVCEDCFDYFENINELIREDNPEYVTCEECGLRSEECEDDDV